MDGTARRLWALDGAWLTMDRTELLEGAEPGRVTFPAPSFLVEHDRGLVLFDTGLDPAAAFDPSVYGGIDIPITFEPAQTVDRQLVARGFTPGDVTHVVISHVHFDHTGGLRRFGHARLVLGVGDRPSVDGDEPIGIARDADLAPVREADWLFVDGDLDLFGDGALTVLAMPGHTPGNTGLLVCLPGRTLLLSGDTAHLHSAVERPAPMSGDTDPVAAVASLHRLRAVAAERDADVWVAHDPDDWAAFGAPGRIV